MTDVENGIIDSGLLSGGWCAQDAYRLWRGLHHQPWPKRQVCAAKCVTVRRGSRQWRPLYS